MICQVEVNGEAVIPLLNGVALVASKSQPGVWHAVKGGRCDCKGFAGYGRCRHVRAVAQLARAEAPAEPPTHETALLRREAMDETGLFLPERPRPAAGPTRSFEDVVAGCR